VGHARHTHWQLRFPSVHTSSDPHSTTSSTSAPPVWPLTQNRRRPTKSSLPGVATKYRASGQHPGILPAWALANLHMCRHTQVSVLHVHLPFFKCRGPGHRLYRRMIMRSSFHARLLPGRVARLTVHALARSRSIASTTPSRNDIEHEPWLLTRLQGSMASVPLKASRIRLALSPHTIELEAC
jgi:hypothetical protein